MSTLYTLHRYRDPSSVSGTGAVATICEFDSGLVAMHWDTATPSVSVYTDIRHIERLHGHEGASELEVQEPHCLVKAYEQVCFWLTREMTPERLPSSVGPHPARPDRLLVKLADERAWLFWIALLDGSSDDASHEQVKNEIVSTWVTPSGEVWLQCTTPGTWDHLSTDPNEAIDLDGTNR